MHATAEQQDTHPPKPANSATATTPIKRSSDSMQNISTFPSQPKGKKRDRSNSESTKREHSLKHYDGDSGQLRSENMLKSEIAKLTEKGGLEDSDSVERLVKLMQPEKPHRKLDLSCRSMLAGIIAATERLDCLNLFIQRRGLPVLDEWLQEVHKGKLGSSTAKDGDRPVEDFLIVLLRALDKLPVNLNALQMCNIGKSVNHLRSHKNLEIQKKARFLVDTWKQRVEVEMNINDAKSSSSQAVPWPSRSKHEVSHGGKRHSSGSSEAVVKTSGQLTSSKSASVKIAQGETTRKVSSASSGIEKPSSPPASTNANFKEGQLKMSIVGGSSEPQSTVREEKSSSSSQSHTNSQCSSDRARKPGNEDARRSTAGSRDMSKIIGALRHRKSANDLQGMAPSAAKKDLGTSNHSSLSRSSASEKVSQSTVSCENALATPVADTHSHKIIAKVQNRGSSAGQSATAGAIDELACMNSRASSPALSERRDQADASLSKKGSNYQNSESDVLPDALPEGKQCGKGNDTAKLRDVPKDASTTGKDSRLLDSSLNALIESCVKHAEATTSVPVGDDIGMNLLASVAAGEMSEIGNASLPVSPLRSTASADNHSTDYQGMTQSNDAEPSKLSGISSADIQQKEEPSSKTNGNLDEFVGDAIMSKSSAGTTEKGTSEGSGQIYIKPASVKGETDSVTDARVVAADFLASEHVVKDETSFEKVTGHSPLPCESNHDGEQRRDSHLLSSSVLIEYKPPSLTNYSEPTSNDGLVASSTDADGDLLQNAAKLKAENTCEVDANGPLDVHGKQRDENDASSSPQKEEYVVDFANSNKKIDCQDDTLEDKEAFANHSGGSPTKETLPSGGEEPHLTSNNLDVIAVEEKQEDKHPAVDAAASGSTAGDPDMNKKLEFDLNEGFNVDDMKNGEPIDFSASSLPTSVSLSSPPSDCPPASVTVAAAAKRPFVPPEDLLRNRTELGWKGSAATSAFRPAEPRKVLEMLSSSKTPPQDAMPCKQVRPLLEIDLNVADERILQDLGSQSSGLKINIKDRHINNSNDEFMSSAPLRYSGGFELDLNRVEEVPESGHHFAGSSQKIEVSTLPVQLSSSSGAAIGQASAERNFDLNNGPAIDEATFIPLVNQQDHSNIPQPHLGLRMNNATAGGMSSWYSPGTAYPAFTMSSALPDRGDLPFPIMAAGVQQRILSCPTSGTSFNPDFYRGSVLSSPAVAFATNAFQDPVFPFGTTFSLPTSSLPGGSAAYMDPSSATRFRAPAIPAHLAGTTAAVPSQYMHPSVNVPDIRSNNVGESSRKWVTQCLDLNSGPGSLDVGGRDERLHTSSRQLSAVSSQGLPDGQARTHQVASGFLKRKEPDGGWDTDRNSYRQSSWQ